MLQEETHNAGEDPEDAPAHDDDTEARIQIKGGRGASETGVELCPCDPRPHDSEPSVVAPNSSLARGG